MKLPPGSRDKTLLIFQKRTLITNHTCFSKVTALLTYMIFLAFFFFPFLVLFPLTVPKQHHLVLPLPVI